MSVCVCICGLVCFVDYLFAGLFVCMRLRLFVWLLFFVRLNDCLLVFFDPELLFACLSVCSFVCPFVCLFVCLRLLVCRFVPFVCSCVCRIVCLWFCLFCSFV